MFFKLINVPLFLISLSIGLFVTYLTRKQTVIYVYPNPDNENKVLFQDRAENCYKFTPKKVDCPADPNKIRDYRIQ